MSSQQERLSTFESGSTLGTVYDTQPALDAYANTHSDYEGQLGNGQDIPTVLESDGEEERCPYCGEWYSEIGSHWSQGSCDHPPVSQYKMKLLKGMCLGDGSVKMDGKNPCMEFQMVNKTFLQYLQQELGWLSCSFWLKCTASESAQHNRKRGFDPDADENDYADGYRFYTKRHPQLQQFADWYHDRIGIVFPEDLSVSSIALKIWYISDGGLNYGNTNPRIQFTSLNESDRPGAIVGALEGHGFTVGHTDEDFRLSTEDTEDFFGLIGDSVPGFEYKWAYEDRERYNRLKTEMREEHCTQTLE